MVKKRTPTTTGSEAPRGELSSVSWEPASCHLTCLLDGKLISVGTVRCFPWSAATSGTSLRDDEGNELTFVEDINMLDGSVRDARADFTFVPKVERVRSVPKFEEVHSWNVEIDVGPMYFQTHPERSARALGTAGVIVGTLTATSISPRTATL